MERIPRGIYTQEFRAQAVRLHEIEVLTIAEKWRSGCHCREER